MYTRGSSGRASGQELIDRELRFSRFNAGDFVPRPFASVPRDAAGIKLA
jgi:hypothetical protein